MLNQPTFLDVAKKFISFGAYVAPAEPASATETGKRVLLEGWQNLATQDLAQVMAWNAKEPRYNCAIVGKAEVGAIWGFDDDGGILSEYESVHGAIKTYRTRSVSGGIHLLFKANAASIAMGNLTAKDENGKEMFSCRVDNRYVIAAGSLAHPYNDLNLPVAAYQAIDRITPIEAPDEFLAFLKERSARKSAKNAKSAKADVGEGGRNNFLASKLGTARQTLGLDREQLFELGKSLNDKHCSPPLSEGELRTISNSIGGYDVKENPTTHVSGLVLSTEGPVPPKAEEPIVVPIDIPPYPNFPRWIFGGIPAYDEWVKPYCAVNSRYSEFMMLPLMVCLLNYLSNSVRIQYKTYPLSIYLLMVGRKGRVIKSSSAQDAMKFCELMGVLTSASSAMKNADGKSVVFTVGSTEGLGMEMSRTNAKSPILFYDEFSKLIAKMSIENSAFANDLSTCYEAGRFSNMTKARKEHFNFEPNTYCLSLIGCTTDKRYPRLASKLYSSVDGMDERFFVLYQPEVFKPVVGQKHIDPLRETLDKTKASIDKALKIGTFKIDDHDEDALDGVANRLGNRLEIRAIKWALAFAVLLGKDVIDGPCLERGIALSNYESQVKKFLNIGESITLEGRHQREIRQIVERNGGSMSLRDLKRKVNYDDFGSSLWLKVYGGLLRDGTLKETGMGQKGDPAIVNVLVPLMVEED